LVVIEVGVVAASVRTKNFVGERKKKAAGLSRRPLARLGRFGAL